MRRRGRVSSITVSSSFLVLVPKLCLGPRFSKLRFERRNETEFRGGAFANRVRERESSYLLVATVFVSGTGTNSLINLPVFGSLRRTTPSKPAEATTLPSGRYASA